VAPPFGPKFSIRSDQKRALLGSESLSSPCPRRTKKMLLQPKSFCEPDTFRCRAKARRLSVFTCMSDYVDANALKKKDTPCFTCPQGEDVRRDFAKAAS